MTNNDSPHSTKAEVNLQARGALFKIIQSHVEYARNLNDKTAVYDDDCTYRLTEAWSCIGTLLTLSRNAMRKSTHTVENDPYWHQTKQVKVYALELLSLGNTWVWPRWANGFEYIDIAMRNARMLIAELQPEEARVLVPWLVRQAIYHDDTDEDRLYGIVEIAHWGDLFGTPKCDELPDEDMPLAYWLLTRLYGTDTVTMHRLLHGDTWCSWKGLVTDRNHPIDISSLNEILHGVRHSVLNPGSLPCETSLPNDMTESE